MENINFVIDEFSLDTYDYSDFTNYLISLEKIDISFLKYLVADKETIFAITSENVAALVSELSNAPIKTTKSKFKFSHVQGDMIYYLKTNDKNNDADLKLEDAQLFMISSALMAPLRDFEAEDKRDKELEEVEDLIISCA